MKRLSTKLVVIVVSVILATSFVASFLYIININIYPGFTIKISSADSVALRSIEITGITVLGRENKLELVNGGCQNENWTFKRINIINKTGYQSKEPVHVAFYDVSTLRLYSEFIIGQSENALVLQSIGQNNSFDSKLKHFIAIIGKNRVFNAVSTLFLQNWLTAIRLSVLLVLIAMAVYFIGSKKKYHLKENRLLNINTIRYFLYALIIIAGVVLRFGNPSTTVLGHDYGGFLLPVFKHFEYGTFDHHEWSYIYPWFIIIITTIFKNIDFVCIIQHSLSVVSVVAFLAFSEVYLFNRLTNHVSKVILTIISIIFLDVLFTNYSLIVYEKCLHHEGLLITSTLLVISLIYTYFNNLSKRRFLVFIITILFLFFVSLLQYRFTVGLFTVALIMLIIECRYQWKQSRKKAIYPVIIFIAGYLLVYSPEIYLTNKYDRENSAFPYGEFFYSNAHAIDKAIKEGIVVDEVYDKTELPEIIADVFHFGAQEHYVTDYDLDYFKYTKSRISFTTYLLKSNGLVADSVRLETEGDCLKYYYIDLKNQENQELQKSYIRFCEIHNQYYKDWAWILLKNFPEEVISKTMKQMGYFFSSKAAYIDCTNNYVLENPSQKYPFQEKYFNLLTRLNYKQGKITYIHFPESGRIYTILGNYFIYFFMISFILYSFYLFFMRKTSLLLLSLTIVFLFTVITVSILQSFENNRYVITLLPLAITSIFLLAYDIIYRIDVKLNREQNTDYSEQPN